MQLCHSAAIEKRERDELCMQQHRLRTLNTYD
jgi:hypothetical protein